MIQLSSYSATRQADASSRTVAQAQSGIRTSSRAPTPDFSLVASRHVTRAVWTDDYSVTALIVHLDVISFHQHWNISIWPKRMPFFTLCDDCHAMSGTNFFSPVCEFRAWLYSNTFLYVYQKYLLSYVIRLLFIMTSSVIQWHINSYFEIEQFRTDNKSISISISRTCHVLG